MRRKDKAFKSNFKSQEAKPRDSIHHVFPSSRTSGSAEVVINSELHDKYHSIFYNRTPFEILEFLERYFWGGDKSIIDAYCERRR